MLLTRYGALTILVALADATEALRGVAPADAEKYVPDADGKWACLSNPEIILDWKQINDDFCDCPDGSDEPGTAACPNGKFWCNNEGHEGQFIPSSLVGDGVCDYDVCCDGSDEAGTVECQNICAQVHEQETKARKEREADRRIALDKVSKIHRAAERQRSKLEEQLQVDKALLGFHTRELARFEKMMQEKQQKAFGPKLLELQKRSDEVKDTISNHFKSIGLAGTNLETLKNTLEKLVATFNANLNDAAVKKTVDDFNGHVTEHKRFYESIPDFIQSQQEIEGKFKGSVQEASNEYDWVNIEFKKCTDKAGAIIDRIADLEDLLKYLSENYNPNFNDPNVKEAVNNYHDYISNKESGDIEAEVDRTVAEILESIKSEVTKIKEAYSPEKEKSETFAAQLKSGNGKSILETLKSKAHFLVNEFLGVAPPKRIKLPEPETEGEFADVLAEFQSNKAEEEKAIASIEAELAKDYGPNDLFRPMDAVSLQVNFGDYEYSLEFTGEVRQKGANGHNVLIGAFDRVDSTEDGPEGLVAYYENGAKCWNGPKRRAVVKVECGAEHNILGVSEPEKCEYHFRMKSPLGCPLPKPKSVDA